jgi:hypothetical protein
MACARKPEDGTQTGFGDDRLAMENSVKGEAILILVAIVLKKGT